MASMVRALLWEFWLRNRAGLTVIAALYPVCVCLFFWLGADLQKMTHLSKLVYMPMGGSLVFLLMIFTYAEVDAKTGHVGFPSHTFTLPVSSRLLVATPMAVGLIVMPLAYLAWAWLINATVNLNLPLWSPLPAIAAGVIWFQAISWRLSRNMLLSMVMQVVMMAVLAGFGLALIMMAMPEAQPKPWMIVGLSLVTPMLFWSAWRVGLQGVRLQRRGEASELNLSNLFDRPVGKIREPFRNVTQAHHWFEWRRGIRLFAPLCTLIFLIIFIIPLLKTSTENNTFWLILVALHIIVPLISTELGMELGKSSFGAKELGMSAFDAVLPRSDAQLGHARLRAAALGLGQTLIVQVFFTVAWVAVSGHWGTFGEMVDRLQAGRGNAFPWILVATIAWVQVGAAWITLSGTLTMGLLGSQKTRAVGIMFGIVAYFSIMAAAVWFYNRPADWQAFQKWLPYPGWLSLAVVAPLLVLLFTLGLKRGHFSTRAVLTCTGILTVSLILAWRLGLGFSLQAADLRAFVVSLTTLTGMGMLSFAAVPFTVNLNRHR